MDITRSPATLDKVLQNLRFIKNLRYHGIYIILRISSLAHHTCQKNVSRITYLHGAASY
jgi:hypothetical protein